MKGLLLAVALSMAFGLMIVVSIPSVAATSDFDGVPAPQDKPLAPYLFRANNNSDLETFDADFKWTGDGSEGNPYIIEGPADPVDANGSATGIFIGNTTKNFEIVGWTIFNCTGVDVEVNAYNPRAAVVLFNVTGPSSSFPSKVRDSDLSDNPVAVMVQGSSNITVHQVVCNNANSTGLAIVGSVDVVVSNNYIINCTRGIFLQGTNRSDVGKNSCQDCETGIVLVRCADVVIATNNCSSSYLGIAVEDSPRALVRDNQLWNDMTGLWLNASSDNDVWGNSMISCIEGFRLEASEGASVTLNTFQSCTKVAVNASRVGAGLEVSNNTISGPGEGISLDSTDGALVRNNSIAGAAVGISLSSCDSIRVINNTLQDCSIGISVGATSTGSRVLGNDIKGSGSEGIIVQEGSSDTDVMENVIIGQTSVGIHVLASDQALVQRNQVQGGGHGMLVASSSNFTSSHNLFTGSARGLELNATYDAKLSYETCQGSSEAGIFLYGSTRASITWSNCSSNDGSGLVARSGSKLTISNSSFFSNAVSGIVGEGETSLRLENCTFVSNGGFGASISSSSAVILQRNLFSLDRFGIRLASLQGAVVRNNQILSCVQEGVVLSGVSGSTFHDNLVQGNGGFAINATSCTNSLFYKNIFSGNRGATSTYDAAKAQAKDDSPSDRWNTTGAIGNHWTDLASPDVDRDGIVDTTYPLVGGAADRKPLSGPLGPVTGAQATVGKVYVLLKWSAPNYTAIYPLSSYFIERRNATSLVTFSLMPGETELNDSAVSAFSDYTYSITALSAYGRSVTIALDVVTVDLTSPTVLISSPAYGTAVNSTSIVAKWSGNDIGSGIARYELSIDGGPWQNMNLALEASLSPQPQGWHNLTVRAWDVAGNTGANRTMFFVDAFAPTLVITTPLNNAVLNHTSLSVRWTSSDNGTGILGYQIRLDQGAWSLIQVQNESAVIIPAGVHVIVVRAFDMVNNTGLSSVQFTVDPYAPVVSITSPVSGFSRDGLVRLAYSAQDNITSILSYDIRADGGAWQPKGMNLSIDLVLGEGEHLLEVRASDLASNFGFANKSVVVDSQAPEVRMESPVNGTYINVKNVQVRWNASGLGAAIAWYELRLDGGTWVNLSVQQSYLTPALSEGEHLVEVRAFDLAGNSGGNSTSFIVDTTAPQVQWLYPLYGTLFNVTNIQVGWNASDENSGLNVTYLILDELGPLDLGQSKNHTLTNLSEGGHGVSVRVYDRAGNSREAGIRFQVDITPPLLSISYPREGEIIQARDINVVWMGSDPGTGLSRFYARYDNFGWVDYAMSFSHVFTGFSDGRHTVYVLAFDNAENQKVRSVNFTVDMSAPIVAIQHPTNGGWVNSTNIVVGWTGSDAPLGMAYYEVRLDGGPWTNVGLNRTFRFDGLNLSAHLLEVKGYSNTSQNTTARSIFGVDLTAPTAPETLDPSRYVNTGRISVAWMPASDNISGVAGYQVRAIRTFFNGTAYVTEVGPWVDVGSVLSYLSTGNPDGWYNVSVRARDRAGNIGPNDTVELVLDTAVPRAISYEPIGSSVPINIVLIIQFSEPMVTSSVNVDVGSVGGSLAWEGSTVLRFTPIYSLAYNTTYEVEVDGRDLAGNSMTPLRYQFVTIPNLGTLVGRVMDERGAPLQGAIVSLETGQTAATDMDGQFRLTAPSGVHTLTIRYEGYGDMRVNVTMTAGQTLDLGRASLSKATTDFSWVIILVFVLLVAVAVELIYLQKKRKN